MSSKAGTDLFALTVFSAVFLAEKFACFCLRGPLVFTAFSIALLTVPKAFLVAFGKAVLNPEISHHKL